MPLFSVVIPAFNRAGMVEEAVESVLGQTFRDFEIIVIDDGSTDRTENTLERYKDRILYHRQANGGVASARNRGVSLSSGKYICYLDSDDLWPENKLTRVQQVLDDAMAPAFVFSDFRKHNINLPQPYELSNTDMFPYIYQYGEQIGESSYLLSGSGKLELLLRGYPLYPSTFVVRRDVHDQFRWDPGILKSEDFNFVLRTSKNFDFLYIDEDLATVRVHDTNKSADFLAKNRTNLLSMKLYRDLYAKPEQRSLCDHYISMRQFLDGRFYLSQGLYRQGLGLIFRSLTYRQNWARLAGKLRDRASGKG